MHPPEGRRGPAEEHPAGIPGDRARDGAAAVGPPAVAATCVRDLGSQAGWTGTASGPGGSPENLPGAERRMSRAARGIGDAAAGGRVSPLSVAGSQNSNRGPSPLEFTHSVGKRALLGPSRKLESVLSTKMETLEEGERGTGRSAHSPAQLGTRRSCAEAISLTGYGVIA